MLKKRFNCQFSIRVRIMLLAMLLTHIAFAGKPRVAVVDFSVKVPRAHAQLGTAMADVLIDALVETGRYRMLERSVLDKVFQEQNLALNGDVDAATSAQIGKLIGAQFLVVGVVSKFQENTGGFGIGGLFKKKIPGGLGMTTAELGITIRIIESTTAEIIASEKVSQKERAVGLGAIIPGLSAGIGIYKSKSMQKAMEKAIEKAVKFIGEQIPEDVEDMAEMSMVEVHAQGLTFSSLKQLMGMVESIEGVENANKKLRSGKGIISLFYSGSIDDFADKLDAHSKEEMKFEIVDLTEQVIEIVLK